jgi:predicted ester cyclase
MFGIPPTGNRIEIHGISFFRFADGKIVEDWVEENTLSVLQQLGVIPPLG